MLPRKPNDYPPSESPLTGILEALEPRITPANFFVGSGGAVVDEHGDQVDQYVDSDTQDWTSTLSAIGAESAFLFKKGDTLGFDSNGNGKFDKGEKILLAVKSGAAVFFLNTENAGSEIAAVSASDKFGGYLSGVVGDVVTSLIAAGKGKSATYDFTTVVQGGSIKGLTIDGYMGGGGGIRAGGDVSAVKITGLDEATKTSASVILAGAFMQDFQVGDLAFEEYVAIPGAAGASISKIWSAGGIQKIHAGDTLDSDESNGSKNSGAGGSISDVVMQAGSGEIILFAGSSGSSETGKGGKGGRISNISISNLSAEILHLVAGGGGDGRTAAGVGGAVSHIRLSGNEVAYMTIVSGDGGSSGRSPAIGAYVDDVTLDITHIGDIEIVSGNGGSGAYWGDKPNVAGKNAGSISNVMLLQETDMDGYEFQSANTVDVMNIFAGLGGWAQGTGQAGAGGSVSNIHVPISTSLTIEAGYGGDVAGDDPAKLGKAGAGGHVVDIVAVVKTSPGSPDLAEIAISGGDAGHGREAAGGNVEAVGILSLAKGASSVKISAGNGSYGFEGGAQSGGNGGHLQTAMVLLPEVGHVEFSAGDAGNGVASGGDLDHRRGGSGGTGGYLKTAFILSSAVDIVELYAGNGGNGRYTGNGGAGGSVTDITLSGLFADGELEPGVFDDIKIFAGYGGSADGEKGKGGNGGNLTKLMGASFNTYLHTNFAVGAGGTGPLAYGKDGKYSDISIINSPVPNT